MAKLEDIRANCTVRIPGEAQPVHIKAVEAHGNTAVSVFFTRADGATGQLLLYRDDEAAIELVDDCRYSFEADADAVRLASEAYRISLAPLFDPYLATRNAAIEPLPHQIAAVYEEMLPRLPLRYVLADDPGAGKTVMAGLLIKEMLARGDVRRCMVVCPGSLAEQWQDELYQKFDLSFTILTNDCFEAAATRNAFNENDLCIARLDKLARDEAIQAKLKNATMWDLVIVDEAHKMSATVTGREVKRTKRYRLGQLLGSVTENLLLMTATPHNGKPQDFQLFMALADPDRFEGALHMSTTATAASGGRTVAGFDVSDIMRRLVKEDLLRFDGTRLFPERRATTVNYELSPDERALYDEVTEYVREEFNRADKLQSGKRRNSVGFALTTLQRRLASSPEAIYQSLRRRRKRLEEQLAELRAGNGRAWDAWPSAAIAFDAEDFDEDDYTEAEREAMDEQANAVSTAQTLEELEAEIATLQRLERKADVLRLSGHDRKWDELANLLQNERALFDGEGQREKLIIFTEHKDTLLYLRGKISALLGSERAVITIQGGMSRDVRREAETRFRQDKEVRILIATDAAGEGINLQCAHLMINYDLPWNPNRLEQRFGRIHRIGQTKVCHLFNLVSAETREGDVFERLLTKLENESKALGGQVFDVLGQVSFGEKSLRELLLEAIRYGDDPKVREQLKEKVEQACNTEQLTRLLHERALTEEHLDLSHVRSIREDMDRAAARKLEPHFIESFCVQALQRFGARVVVREPGRYEVYGVPPKLRAFAEGAGHGTVLKSYERVCFAKDCCACEGAPDADLVCLDHPLLQALVGQLLREDLPLLQQGCVFIDEQNRSAAPRLLAYVECMLRDGTKRVVSKSVRFVELDEKGAAHAAGYAPYLDYNAPDEEERAAVLAWAAQAEWLDDGAGALATAYAEEHIVPEQLRGERARRTVKADKTQRLVHERLEAEIRYWSRQFAELQDKGRQGQDTRVSAHNARTRIEELRQRLSEREERLGQERTVTAEPVHVVGVALVAPRCFVDGLLGHAAAPSADAVARARIEQAAMQAVMAIERELGNEPVDVSADNRGWDVESRAADGLRFIEVKGRAAGACEVTVTHNELMGAMNQPERFVLAIVEVGEGGQWSKLVYLKRPFDRAPDAATVNTTYNIERLKRQGTIELERERA